VVPELVHARLVLFVIWSAAVLPPLLRRQSRQSLAGSKWTTPRGRRCS